MKRIITMALALCSTLKWRPRIEQESYEPKKHGWTMNSGTILLRFGTTQKTDANQNVYRSLQFKNGNYKLHFKADGDAEKQIKVQIQKLTSPKNYLLNTSVAANCEADLLFSVEDGWGEYKLTITRPSSDVTAIHTSVAPTPSETTVYTLSGIKASQTPRHGAVLIKNNKKILTP